MTDTNKTRSEQIRRTEEDVLRVVTKSDPSTRGIASSPKSLTEHEARLTTLYRDHLKFPPEMFRNAKLLDVGAGSGENTVFYARWGATCTLLDMNAAALAAAERTFARYAPQEVEHQIVNESLFESDLGTDFDIVVSTGVLHHNAYHGHGFAQMIRHLRPGGYALIGVGNSAGFFQRNLQRTLLFRLASSNEEIIALARRLFPENLARAVKLGGRTEKAVIYDTYINPKLDAVSTKQVIGWFKDAGLRFYSGWPRVFPPQAADSGTQPLFDICDFPEAATFLELLALAHDKDDHEDLQSYFESNRMLDEHLAPALRAVNDASPEKQVDIGGLIERLSGLQAAFGRIDPFAHERRKVDTVVQETVQLLQLADQGDIDQIEVFLKKTKHLFRGTNGIGMTYYAAYRPID